MAEVFDRLEAQIIGLGIVEKLGRVGFHHNGVEGDHLCGLLGFPSFYVIIVNRASCPPIYLVVLDVMQMLLAVLPVYLL